jgi:hypothetical protein
MMDLFESMRARSPKYLGTTFEQQRPPTITGPAGQGWHIELPDPEKRDKADWQAGIGMWVMEIPRSHPLWWNYVATMIHLRDIDGVKPAVKDTPESEYEISIYSLNPEIALPSLAAMEKEKLADGDKSWYGATLHPPDIVVQFGQVGGDANADEILEACVKACVHGYISPDQDFRVQWAQMLANTVKHYQEGTHGQKRH